MPTYQYETIPTQPGQKPLQFELQQSMQDAPLQQHPQTGEPLRRIISGGFGHISSGPRRAEGGHSCGSGCGCH